MHMDTAVYIVVVVGPLFLSPSLSPPCVYPCNPLQWSAHTIMRRVHRKRFFFLRSKTALLLTVVALSLCFSLDAVLTLLSLDPLGSVRLRPLQEDRLRCFGDRLLVNATSRQMDDNSGVGVIPMMIVPLMLDLPEFKKLMCNISVPIRLLVLVQNGVEEELSAFLLELEKQYGWSGRLVVVRHPENVGYSGAMNTGFRLAMSLPREDVPFVFLTNSDVTFSPDLLPRLLREVHNMTRHDAARMDELRAEVASEQDSNAPAKRQMRVLRAPRDGNSTLSTSELLPDRIRYTPFNERQKAFAQHYGFFCPGPPESCFTSVILTRLAISTVGYFDENFFPAYVEDVDYELRLRMLGFKMYRPTYGTFVHYKNLNTKKAKVGNSSDASWYLRVKRLSPPYTYRPLKWYTYRSCCFPLVDPFHGHVPLDVWVRDDARIERFRA